MKKLVNSIKAIWKKHEEGFNYLFWGGVAFLLSMVLFWLFTADTMFFKWDEVTANNIDWIICVIFTFFTNKIFVFKSKTNSFKAFIIEFTEFALARLFTLLLEDLVLYLLCDKLGWNTQLLQLSAKLIGQFVVIVTNYILSKLIIFKKKKD